MRDNKLILPYKDDEGNIYGETVRTTKDGDYYRIEQIPLYASKIALYDIIEAHRRGGKLYFHRVIESSGRSVIQMKIFDGQQIKAIAKVLKQFECKWRYSDDNLLIAFDVRKYMPYIFIKIWLDQGEKEGLWVYREACLSHE